MKKTYALFLTILISNLIFSQEVFNEKTMIKEYQKIKKIIKKSISSKKTIDTIFISHNKEIPLRITKYFDSENRLVKKYNRDPDSYAKYEAGKNKNNSRLRKLKGGRIEYYDTNGNLILIKNEDLEGEIWFLSLNQYDEKNRLTKKRMFDIQNIYKIEYEYTAKNEKPIEHFFDSNGNISIESKYNGKRNNPYK